jgi:hypothetical protein
MPAPPNTSDVGADQVRQDVDAEVTAHMLAGALFAAHVSGRIDAGWLQRAVNSLLEGLRPARRGR